MNQKGLDFYDRLFDAMGEAGLQPWVTMFHWDLPQSLETRFGGWRDRRVADAFATYADTIVKAYGDRVKNWITLNEILCFTYLGYGNGQKAPGLKLPTGMVNQTYHHALLCHGHGVRAVREHGGRGARVGLTDNSHVSIPVTETPADITAARATSSKPTGKPSIPSTAATMTPTSSAPPARTRPSSRKTTSSSSRCRPTSSA